MALPIDFTIGDYGYRILLNNRVGAIATDTTKTSYADIPSTVTYNGTTYTVTTLESTFYGCVNMVTPPSIPNTVTSMASCFRGCTSLATPPTIPNSVTAMGYCFSGCTSLTTPPIIPSGVTNIASCFQNCTSLTTAPTLPSGATYLGFCFENCVSLTTAPTIPSGVTDMTRCFSGCVSLTAPPTIPNGVTYLGSCFRNTRLTTNPTIPNSVTDMSNCFAECVEMTTPPTIPNSVTNISGCFSGCSALATTPNIPNSVTDMRYTFDGCSALTTLPTIPSGVTTLLRCFRNCVNLTGNIVINTTLVGTGTENATKDIFTGTQKPIYIINGGNADITTWETIAGIFQNVHYEANDNPIPTINSFSVKRVASSGSTTPSATGTWAYVEALINIYDTNLPVGWSVALKSRTLDVDSSTVSPTWLPSPISSYPATTYCWVDINDFAKHNFALSIADTITSGGVEKKSNTSTIVTAIIAKAYALVDYYHDDNTGTEGMAIGKLAEDADLLEVAMPTLFREAVTVADANNVLRALFDFMHPVGSYYETSDTTFDPNVTWGGTWSLETAGQVHISAGTGYPVAGALTNTTDGGAETVTLDETMIPAHTHGSKSLVGGFTSRRLYSNYQSIYADGICSATLQTQTSSSVIQGATPNQKPDKITINATHEHDSVGGGQAHNNMQPYIVVNRWHRTA